MEQAAALRKLLGGCHGLRKYLHDTQSHQRTNGDFGVKADHEMLDYEYRYNGGSQVSQGVEAYTSVSTTLDIARKDILIAAYATL